MKRKPKDIFNRRGKDRSAPNSSPAGMFFIKFKYLLNEINVSLALLEMNRSNNLNMLGMLRMKEESELRDDILQFSGILNYLESCNPELLVPYREKIEKLKSKARSLSL